MSDETKTLIDLETRFWQAMVDGDHATANSLQMEPAVMVSQHGAFQFDHEGYRKAAEQGPRVITSFKLADVKVIFPNADTAVITYQVKQGIAPRDNKSAAEFEEMHDSSTWVRAGKSWKCVVHTETPLATETAH